MSTDETRKKKENEAIKPRVFLNNLICIGCLFIVSFHYSTSQVRNERKKTLTKKKSRTETNKYMRKRT